MRGDRKGKEEEEEEMRDGQKATAFGCGSVKERKKRKTAERKESGQM